MHKKLGIVLVVYKRKLEESEGYQILMKLHASHKEVFKNIDMLVINNHKEYQQKNENKADNSIVIEIYYYSHNYVLTNKMKNY